MTASPPDLPAELAELDALLTREILQVTPEARAQAMDDAGQFDHALHGAMARLGVWGLGVPRDAGGIAGASLRQLAAIRALGDHVTSMGVYAVVRFLCTRLLSASANAAQREAWLRPLAAGEMTAAFCITERQGGTDILRLMTTAATRTEDGWRIDGSKAWISGADAADYLIVVARTAPGKADGVSMFIVPRDTPGITVRRINTFAIRAYEVSEVVLDGVRVSDEALLGKAGEAFRQIMATLNVERLSGSANALGMTRGALRVGADYARQREAFGKTLSEMQAIQHRLAEAAVSYEVAWTYLEDCARALDAGERIDVASSMAKLAAARAVQQATDVGMELMGAAVFDMATPMQRYYRDHRLYMIAPINNDMSRNLVAERYFGFKRGF